MAQTRIEGFNRSLAYIVAIDRYIHGIPVLRTPVADGLGLAQLLEDAHEFEVKSLFDEQATLDGILRLLDEILQTASADDRVLFYFAGHGVTRQGDDGPQGFLLPQDASKQSDANYVSMSMLSSTLEKLACRHVFVILDCCFSGAFRWASTRNLIFSPELVHEERYHWFIRGQAWQALASTSPDELALDIASGSVLGMRDTEKEHSPFAKALLTGLAGSADRIGASGRGDGVITATELFLYIEEYFADAASREWVQQTPLLWPMRKHDKGQYIFLVPGRRPDLPRAPRLEADSNPWRGLEPYRSDQAELFFGRRQVSLSLKGHVERRQLTAVIGPSGIGKSSLVLAGLVPLLSQTLVVTIKPGARPVQSIAEAIGIPISTGHELAEALRRRSAVCNCAPLLIIDQLEEIYTMGADGSSSRSFLDIINGCVETGAVRIVCTLRAEFEPQIMQSPLEPHWSGARFLVPHMGQDEFRRVIEGPANVRALRFDPEDLVDRLINEVVQMPGALPLLSFALSQMFRHYIDSARDDRAITEADFDDLKGGVVGALQASADRIVAELTAGQRATARRVLERLVSINAGEFARRRVAGSELLSLEAVEGGRVSEVLKRFDQVRLIVSDDSGGEVQYELAHDAMTLSWQTLANWVRTDAPRIFDLRRLTADAELWHASDKRKAGLLWSDAARHASLTPLMCEAFPGLNKRELDFADASKKRARRTSGLRWATVIALMMLSGSAMVAAVVAWDRSRTAVSRQLASQAMLAARESQLSTALLLAVAAVEEKGTEEAHSALLQALLLAGHVQRLHRFSDRHPNVLAMAGPERVAVGFLDGVIEVHAFATDKPPSQLLPAVASAVIGMAASGERIFALHRNGNLVEVAAGPLSTVATHQVPEDLSRYFGKRSEGDEFPMSVSPDGQVVAIGGSSLHLFDIAARQWSSLPSNSGGLITRVKFIPRADSAVALAWSNGSVEVLSLRSGNRVLGPFNDHPERYVQQSFDPATGEPSSPLIERYDAPVMGLDVSPDGSLIASGGNDRRVVLRSLADGVIHLEPFTVTNNVVALAFDYAGLAVIDGGARWYEVEKRVRPLEGVASTLISRIDIAPNSGHAAMLSGDELVLWNWDVMGAAKVAARRDVSGIPPLSENLRVSGLDGALWLGDGSPTIVTTSGDAALTVWRVEDPSKSATAPRGENQVNDGAILASHNREVVAVGGNGIDFWTVPKEGPPKLQRHVVEQLPIMLDVAFTEDGSGLVGASRAGVHRISLRDGSWSEPKEFLFAEEAVIGRDRTRVAFSGRSEVVVRDLDNRDLITITHAPARSVSPRVALSGDGDILAIDHRTYVELWRVDSKAPLRRIETGGQDWIVRDIELSPDGELLSVWESNFARSLWSVKSGTLLYRLRNPNGCCSTIWKFDGVGQRIAEVGSHGVTIWDLSPNRWKVAACSIVGRSATDVEKTRYFGGENTEPCQTASQVETWQLSQK